MLRVIRGILGVIAGLVVGAFATGGVEGLGHALYPLPQGTNVYDPEVQKTLMNIMPFEAKLAVVVAWAIGIFAGSTVAIMVGQRASWPAWVVGVLLLAFALTTMAFIPHPVWMLWAATAGTLVSAILAAYMFARS